MKKALLLFAACIAFGLSVKETASPRATANKPDIVQTPATVENPVVEFLLRSFEVVLSSQNVIAGI